MAKPSDWNCIHLSAGQPPMPLMHGYIDSGGRFRPDEASEKAPLVALIPADRCNVISVDLPELSGRKLEQALRWAAEDVIAGPVEDQHVAAIQREADGRLRCIVCSNKDMQQWLDALPGRPHRIVPDAACLPWQRGQISLMRQQQHWLVRWSETGFDRVEPEVLELMLPELLENSTASNRLVCYQTARDDTVPDGLNGSEVRRVSLDETPLALLAVDAVDSPVNLMQGEYSAIEPGSQNKRWRLTALLAAAIAVLLIVYSVSESWLLERKSEQLDRQITQQFQQVFPEVTRVQRPRAQAEQAMALLAGGGSDTFVGINSRISEVLTGASGIQVEALNYVQDQISLSLTVAGTDDLEALQQQLHSIGLVVVVEQLQVQPEGSQARLSIRPGES
ncbi:MAG: type II secretion system protein GspL [Pseudomonadota bacterium]